LLDRTAWALIYLREEFRTDNDTKPGLAPGLRLGGMSHMKHMLITSVALFLIGVITVRAEMDRKVRADACEAEANGISTATHIPLWEDRRSFRVEQMGVWLECFDNPVTLNFTLFQYPAQPMLEVIGSLGSAFVAVPAQTISDAAQACLKDAQADAPKPTFDEPNPLGVAYIDRAGMFLGCAVTTLGNHPLITVYIRRPTKHQ
jgi:hypothetical protein